MLSIVIIGFSCQEELLIGIFLQKEKSFLCTIHYMPKRWWSRFGLWNLL